MNTVTAFNKTHARVLGLADEAGLFSIGSSSSFFVPNFQFNCSHVIIGIVIANMAHIL